MPCVPADHDWQADLIIRLGHAPIARSVFEWCGRHNGTVIRIDRQEIYHDFLHETFVTLIRPNDDELAYLADQCALGDETWLQQWLMLNHKSQALGQQFMQQLTWSEPLVAQRCLNHEGHHWCHIGNSLAIRYANILFNGHSRQQPCYANRGVNGIDGTIGTFLGESYHHDQQRGILMLGDLSFIHDLPALVGHQAINGTIVVIDNDGGGIFDLLPVSKQADYEQLIRCPRPIAHQPLAQAFGLHFLSVATIDELNSALDQAASQSGLSLIVARCDAADTASQMRRLIGAFQPV